MAKIHEMQDPSVAKPKQDDQILAEKIDKIRKAYREGVLQSAREQLKLPAESCRAQ
jgi:hypothetical protein